MSDFPDGITLGRNVDLHTPWLRRALLCCIAALPVLALLNVFGQDPTTSYAHTSAVSVSVTAPARLRSGLIFQVHVKVIARRTISQLEIVFDSGWWESMSVNAIAPEPSESQSENGQVVLSYGKLQAHDSFSSWIYFQVNPTNVGKRREDVEIRDGTMPLAHIHRSLTIFP
jgi:Mn2+/Fe2+ NRAMP family transporter